MKKLQQQNKQNANSQKQRNLILSGSEKWVRPTLLHINVEINARKKKNKRQFAKSL